MVHLLRFRIQEPSIRYLAKRLIETKGDNYSAVPVIFHLWIQRKIMPRNRIILVDVQKYQSQNTIEIIYRSLGYEFLPSLVSWCNWWVETRLLSMVQIRRQLLTNRIFCIRDYTNPSDILSWRIFVTTNDKILSPNCHRLTSCPFWFIQLDLYQLY